MIAVVDVTKAFNAGRPDGSAVSHGASHAPLVCAPTLAVGVMALRDGRVTVRGDGA
jgi:hypothetical protein